MTAADWIAEQRRIEQAATEGPWIAATGAYAWDNDDATHVWHRKPIGNDGIYEAIGKVLDNELDQTAIEDAEFIADSRTALPKALAALEAVLALHAGEHQHYSPFIGAMVVTCSACGEPTPCPTARTITEALGVES